MCVTGKLPYTKKGAKRRKKKDKQIKHIYYCKHCGGWHLTSKAFRKIRNTSIKDIIDGNE